MKIKSFASSSKGNCYLIDDGRTQILIECGISIAKIRKALDYKLSGVSGCLSSHSHRDHCKAAQGIIRAGVDLYTSQETIDSLEISSHRVNVIKARKRFEIGTFHIMPFETIHDTPGSLGFLIASHGEKLLFITDSAYVKHKFNGITHLMIESNYQPEILEQNIINGSVSESQKNRLLFSHMSLDNVLKFLGDMDRSKLQEIFLMHLSAGNSNAVEMKRKVVELTRVPTTVCKE